MKSTLRKLLLVSTAILFLLTNNAASIIYVNNAATGTNDGSSWANAFTEIQSAITVSKDGDTICVAAGEYQPTFVHGPDPLRSVTFYIDKPISLFGGFTGMPGTEGNFSQRDPKTNRTVLTGDVGIVGDHTDNAFHVVFIDHVSDSMRLDGFAISFGNNTGAGGLDGYGAGIFNDATAGRSNPTLVNNAICFNTSSESGGGIMNYAAEGGVAKPVIMNCIITENNANGGGGISNYTDDDGEVSPSFINCKIAGNEARTADGGAMNVIGHSATVTPQLINCIVTGNHSPSSAAIQLFVTGTGIANPQIINSAFAGNTGGSIRIVDLGTGLSKATIRNSILWGNTGGHGLTTNNAQTDVSFSIIQFGFAGEGNIGEDPQFILEPTLDAPHIDGDLHLQESSLAIDAGSNDVINNSIETDFDNLPRFVDPATGQSGIIDIGPYEIQSITTGFSTPRQDFEWNVYPNPADDQINFNIENLSTTSVIRLINASGSILHLNQLVPGQTEDAIQVAGLPAGNYFLYLNSGENHSVRKIILQ